MRSRPRRVHWGAHDRRRDAAIGRRNHAGGGEAVTAFLELRNGAATSWGTVPVASFDAWRTAQIEAIAAGGHLASLFITPHEERTLLAVIAASDERLLLGATRIGDSYPALTLECPEAHWFEREITELTGVVPEGHPWTKPIRFTGASDTPAVTRYFTVDGDEVHEVAVGPVHAGIIEPGHFRFQCHGERVLHLEISLGYQHRGVERALVGGPNARTIHYMETLAGDTTVGHALAYAMVREGLGGMSPPSRAESVRGVALEFERLANHTGDLGALANDIGFLPTAAYCGRLRGSFLNLTADVCGSRLGRGWIRPGGCRFDVEPDDAPRTIAALEEASEDVRNAVDLLWRAGFVRARFEDTGRLTLTQARELGLVGPIARASGLARDVRADHPTGVHLRDASPVRTSQTGDVLARAEIRWLEIQDSIAFAQRQLAELPKGVAQTPCPAPAPNAIAVALVEGWRGEICHVALTDAHGAFAQYKIVDPSFHNWFGLAMAMRDQEISDFPLCNKSFNLSYCGHDL